MNHASPFPTFAVCIEGAVRTCAVIAAARNARDVADFCILLGLRGGVLRCQLGLRRPCLACAVAAAQTIRAYKDCCVCWRIRGSR